MGALRGSGVQANRLLSAFPHGGFGDGIRGLRLPSAAALPAGRKCGRRRHRGHQFAAVLLFVAVAGLLGSAFVATLAKTLITFATAAFLVFLAQGGYSPLSSALMSTGYSLFEMTTYLVLAELALSLRVRPLSLLSGFYLIETVGYLLGCSLEAATGPGGLDRRMVAAVLALALLICAVWVFTEKHVNDLLWGRGDGSAGGDAVRRQEIDIDAGVLGSLTGGAPRGR